MTKKITITILGIFFALALLPSMALAGNDTLTEATFNVGEYLNLDEGEQDQEYFDDQEGPIIGFILRILNYATGIMGSIGVILMIIAGFRFMAAQGNQQNVDEAKDMVKYAVIGLVVAFSSYVVVIFVQSVFIPQ